MPLLNASWGKLHDKSVCSNSTGENRRGKDGSLSE